MELKKIAVFSAPNDPVCPQHQSIIQQPLQILKSFSQIYDEYAQTNDIDAMVMWPLLTMLVEFWPECAKSQMDSLALFPVPTPF